MMIKMRRKTLIILLWRHYFDELGKCLMTLGYSVSGSVQVRKGDTKPIRDCFRGFNKFRREKKTTN